LQQQLPSLALKGFQSAAGVSVLIDNKGNLPFGSSSSTPRRLQAVPESKISRRLVLTAAHQPSSSCPLSTLTLQPELGDARWVGWLGTSSQRLAYVVLIAALAAGRDACSAVLVVHFRADPELHSPHAMQLKARLAWAYAGLAVSVAVASISKLCCTASAGSPPC
jgi:hypothetical protein